jgi:hypothetical protein
MTEAPPPAASPELFSVMLAKPLEDLPIPASGPYYVQDRDGFLVHKTTRLGRVLVRLDKAPDTITKYDFSGFLWKDIPKIDDTLLAQIRAFFAAAYESMHAEAMVLLTLTAENKWGVIVPPQTVDYASIDYKFDPKIVPEDVILAGTAHSHCNFSAFHSHTDEGDAAKKDGLHLTFGHVDSDKFEVAAMLSFGGVNWDLKLDEITDVPEGLPTADAVIPLIDEWQAAFKKDTSDTAWIKNLSLTPPQPMHMNQGRLTAWSGGWNDGWYDAEGYVNNVLESSKKTDTTKTYGPRDRIDKWPALEARNLIPRAKLDEIDRYNGAYPNTWHFSKNPQVFLRQIEWDLEQLLYLLRNEGLEFYAEVTGMSGYGLVQVGELEFGDYKRSQWDDCDCEHECGR